MIRREFIAGLGGAAAWPVAARAQQRSQIKRIAFAVSAGRFNIEPIFRQELAKLGWVEGRDVRIEALYAVDGHIVRAAAPFVVATAPDLIVVVNTEFAQIFKEVTDTIPIVFAFVADPVASNLVKNLARPGGNLTGFTNLPQFSLVGKWLGLLKELVPGVDRVMVLSDPANVGLVSQAQEAALPLHVTIHPVITTATLADAEREIEAFASESRVGMIVVPYALTISERTTIVALAARHHLPAIYGGDIFVSGGGLASYAAETDEISRNAAHYADRILRGAKPADLPVQAPTKFRLVINTKTATALGLTVPPMLLALADEVIE
jgi:putative tryptophan/tyrosine transport system substrate-binding protein